MKNLNNKEFKNIVLFEVHKEKIPSNIDEIIRKFKDKQIWPEKDPLPKVLVRESKGLYLYAADSGKWLKTEIKLSKPEMSEILHKKRGIIRISEFGKSVESQINGIKHNPVFAKKEPEEEQKIRRKASSAETKDPVFGEVVKRLQEMHAKQHSIFVVYVDQKPDVQSVESLVGHSIAYIRYDKELYYYNVNSVIKEGGVERREILYQMELSFEVKKQLAQNFDQAIMGYSEAEKASRYNKKQILGFEQLIKIHEKYSCKYSLDHDDNLLILSAKELLAIEPDVGLRKILEVFLDRHNLYGKNLYIKENMLDESPSAFYDSASVRDKPYDPFSLKEDQSPDGENIKLVLINIYSFLMLSRVGIIENNIFIHNYNQIVAESRGSLAGFVTDKFQRDHFPAAEGNKQAQKKSNQMAKIRLFGEKIPRSTGINGKLENQEAFKKEITSKREPQPKSYRSFYDLAADNARTMASQQGSTIASIVFCSDEPYVMYSEEKISGVEAEAKKKTRKENEQAYFWYALCKQKNKSLVHHLHGTAKNRDEVPEGYIPIQDIDKKPMPGCFVKLVSLGSEQMKGLAGELERIWKI